MTGRFSSVRGLARVMRLANVMFLDGFRAAPGWMALVTALLVVGSIASTCYPLGYRFIVDGTLGHRPTEALAGIGMMALLLGLGWGLTSIGANDAMALSDRIALYRTAELMRLVGGLSSVEHLERPEYLAQVERLVRNRRQLASAPRQMLSNVSSIARIATLLVLLALVSPWLLLLPIAVLPPLVADRIAKRIVRRTEDAGADDGRLAGMVFSLLTDPEASGEVRVFGIGDRLRGLHRRLSDGLNSASRREAIQLLVVQGAGWLLYACVLMGAIAFVVVSAAGGLITLGTVLMTVSLIRRSRNQLSSAASGSGALVSTLSTADRMFWLQDQLRDERAALGRDAPPERLFEGIRVRDLGFRYPGTEREVLAGIDLELPAGSTVALLGENGSGKTTLVTLLLGLHRPTSGSIELDGRDLADLDPAAWRARCTAAFQDFARLQLSAVEGVGVADLVSLGDEPKAAAALERAGAGDLVAQLPAGLATRLGSPAFGGHNLSGGQWQKVALGRTMRRPDPLLVVLDEPTASLDAHAEHALFERYAEAARTSAERSGAITMLVSHRLTTASSADLIVLLDGGRVVEQGSHEELMAAGGRYAELFELQAREYR
jgi:ATP-binding cassette subfamily B protein